jgi:flagellar export protein FliJ
MTVRPALTRLLRVRELEEELTRIALEAAVVERDRVEREMAAVRERKALGRMSFAAGIEGGNGLERAGGLVAMELAENEQRHLTPRLQAADNQVALRRAEFLARRIGRRQAETLLTEAKRTAAAEADRRAQQMLDDWYGRRGLNRTQASSGRKTMAKLGQSEDFGGQA